MAASHPAKFKSISNPSSLNLDINQVFRGDPTALHSNKAGIPGRPSAIPINTLQRCKYIRKLLSKDTASFLDFFKLLIALVPEKDPRRNGCACNIQNGPQAPKPHNQPGFNHNTCHFALEVSLTMYHRQWMYSLARKLRTFQAFFNFIPSSKPLALENSTPVSLKLNFRFGQNFAIEGCKVMSIVDNGTFSQKFETSLPSQTTPPLASLDKMTLGYEPTCDRTHMSLTLKEQVVLSMINASLKLLERLVISRRYLQRLATRIRIHLLAHSHKSLGSLDKRSSDRFTSETALFEAFALNFASFDRGEAPNVKPSLQSAVGHLTPLQSAELDNNVLFLTQAQPARPSQPSSSYEKKLATGSFSSKCMTVISNQKDDANSFTTAQGDFILLDILRLVLLYLAFRLYLGMRFWPTRFKKLFIPQFHYVISKIMAIYSAPHFSIAASQTNDDVRLPEAELPSTVPGIKLSPLIKGTTSIMKLPGDVGCSAGPPQFARKVSWNVESGSVNSDKVTGNFSDGEETRRLSHIHHKNSKIMPKSPKPQTSFALTQNKKELAKPNIERFRLADRITHGCTPISPLSSSIPTSSSSSSKNEDQTSEEETNSIIEHILESSKTQIMISSPPKI